MKKFKVKDGDKEYEVTETETVESNDQNELPEQNETTHDEDEGVLTAEEIRALKELAKIAPKLTAMCSTTDEETVETENEQETEFDDEEESVEETILKTDSIKRSAASLEKNKKFEDSIETDNIANAWAKRFQTFGR